MARYSLNEIEASARKAARGAGMAWGLAEEAGKATRWLAARGLPSVPVLLALLRANDGKAYETLRPQGLNGCWRASGDALCPVIAGSALNDLAERLIAGEVINLSGVRCPALILPILGRAAKALGQGFAIAWSDARITILPDSLYLEAGAIQQLLADFAESVTVGGVPGGAAVPEGERIIRVVRGVPLAAGDWDELQAYAARTYVPASEESRLRGAGAGLNDND